MKAGKGKREKGKETGSPVRAGGLPLFSFPFSLFQASHALVCAWLLLQCATFRAGAQEKPALGTGHGLAETIEAIERARVVTRVLYVTAHPDDESGAVLAWLARGAYADVALLSLTRGEGGQNALGPEMAPQLGLLRTEELLNAAKHYGVRVYFGGADDFGFSKSADEALKVWGEPVLANMVRVIREFRPHIIINNWGGVRTGHGQHQAAGILTPQAMEAAANPEKFPEQIREGLKAWKADSLLQFTRNFGQAPANRAPDPGSFILPTQETSPVWGRSYNEIGAEGYTKHATQGVAAFGNSAFFRGSRAVTLVSGAPVELARFSRTLGDLAVAVAAQDKALREMDQFLRDARAAAVRLDWNAAASALARAGRIVGETNFGGADGKLVDATSRAHKKIDAALALVSGVRLDARADRGEITPGSVVTVRAFFQRRDTRVTWGDISLALPDGWTVVKKETEESGALRFDVQVPNDAKRDNAFHMGIEPWPAPLIHARVKGTIDGYSFEASSPVSAQRVTTTRVDTLPLMLVPAVTVTPEPQQFVVSERAGMKPLEIRARVRHYGTGEASVTAGVNVPAGWNAPAPVTLKFTGAGDQLVRFSVTPPAKLSAGQHTLKTWAERGGRRYETSLELLPTLPTRLWSEPAAVRVHVFDLNVPAGLRVGYVAADNDPIPEALRQVGVQVDLLDEAALAFGDLKQYDAIAVGIRAYELRQDLIRANQRLLDYAAAGGTLVVQYQRESVWDALKPAPYPAVMNAPRASDDGPRRTSPRVTIEDAPVKLLAPGHPVLSFPNKIAGADFDGWVQERALYCWSQFDAKYTPLLTMNDPGEPEANGALVVAPHGKGLYIYTALSLFRQIPAGVPGGYRLFINLLAQSKATRK